MAEKSNADHDQPDSREWREAVRDRYTDIAKDNDCCGPDVDISCCGDEDPTTAARRRGYDESTFTDVPVESYLGVGCGNPEAIERLSAGETVVDLGSGGGFDCFQAARQVCDDGLVIGIDMTPEMIDRARENATDGEFSNVEFRLGEIEHLPVADDQCDVVISNCVINLSPNKPQVFEEAYRVLAPGGRLAISDIVRIGELPQKLQEDPQAVAECVGGTVSSDDLSAMIESAGFEAVTVDEKRSRVDIVEGWSNEYDLGEMLVPASVRARKPKVTSDPSA